MLKPYTWQLYSKKMKEMILQPTCLGKLEERDGMRLVTGVEDGQVQLYFLVDESDGIVADAKFQLFGPTALVAVCEMACRLALRKHYGQVMRFTASLIDKELSMPEESAGYLNLVLSVIDHAMEQCEGLPLPEEYIAPPLPEQNTEAREYPGFTDLEKTQKIAVIEQVIDVEIRPYVELDDGGVRIVDLKGDEVIIAYEGACTSCYSATGATLNAIDQMLKSKVHPSLEVKPDLSTLEF